MDNEELHFIVVSNQPDKLAILLEQELKELRIGSLRQISPAGLTTLVLLPHEILIFDFVSMDLNEVDDNILCSISGHLLLGLFPPSMDEASVNQTVVCTDTVSWPPKQDELKIKLQRLCQLALVEHQLDQSLALKLNLVGESEVFQRVVTNIKKYSKCNAPVLVLGETGTGKEKIARAIHYAGVDDGKPFVAVNCGCLPDSLVENELFGHVRGAYTDARELQCGLVEQAEGGTLFLDEIEALSHKGQIALLRFLQDYEYRPLGSQHTKHASVRMITASNESLEKLVDQGAFRKDLFYRINILPLTLPPLRKRGSDILLLAEYFLDKYRAVYGQNDRYLDPQTLLWMSRYSWPGNVRELENLILREFLLADSACINIRPINDVSNERRRQLQDRRRFSDIYNRSFQDAKSAVVKEFEHNYLQYVLEDANGNISQAARQAGKERRSFTRLLDKYGFAKKGDSA
jgi:DNA-binding NtrC family response regulator